MIKDNTISRKHLTIEVGVVAEGDGTNLDKRSLVTIEDLKTKIGTLVNGKQIRGERFNLVKDTNEIKLGRYQETFRITWHPVVLSFSFSEKELEADPWADIRQNLEPFDVKYIAEFDHVNTTHVVSKRRNTSKVLQALITGRYIVVEGFMQAIVEAATPEAGDVNGTQFSALEMDFDANWPEAMRHLPPKTDAPGADRPDDIFAPDERRRNVFDGYTFIFYERRRFEELHPAITSGKGKALLNEVEPGLTSTDEFIRYVKGVAGEKGLGEFEDGSEGKGVVVVRYTPSPDHENAGWYMSFYSQVALRLDHRPVEPRDFLPAILDVDPGKLRRPLEFDLTQREQAGHPQEHEVNSESLVLSMDVDEANEREAVEERPSQPSKTRRRDRRAPRSRFKGFDTGIDEDDEEANPASRPDTGAELSQVMFMTQPEETPAVANPSQRKRLLPEPERDIMEDIAPTAAAIKRRRLEAGEENNRPREQTTLTMRDEQDHEHQLPQQSDTGRGKAAEGGRKGKRTAQREEDLLDLAIQYREEEEAIAQAERERLARELRDGDIDYEAIRRLTIVEPMNIRRPQERRTREQDIQEGRWDPRWNGRKNYKKFRKQGEMAARPQQRVMLSLEPARVKVHGIGNDYWLKGGGAQGRRGKETSQTANSHDEAGPKPTAGRARRPTSRAKERDSYAIGSDDSGDDGVDAGNDSSLADVMDLEGGREPARSKKGKAITRQSQAAARQNETQAIPSRSQKRGAVESPTAEKPAKRRAVRPARVAAEESDEEDDESDDGLNFGFGKRR